MGILRCGATGLSALLRASYRKKGRPRAHSTSRTGSTSRPAACPSGPEALHEGRVATVTFGKYDAEHVRRRARDERRSAARELLREVRAGDGQARKGVAREAACSAAPSVRDRVRVRKPERARDLVFADRARLRGTVLARAVPARREAVLRAGRSVVEVGSEQAAARSRQGASCRAERSCG